jgi:hypothetical protein
MTNVLREKIIWDRKCIQVIAVDVPHAQVLVSERIRNFEFRNAIDRLIDLCVKVENEKENE